MVIVFAAVYKEVQPIIESLVLTKTDVYNPFSCYESDTVRVVITGVGKLKMSTAVGFVLGKTTLSKVNHVVNVGVCAGDNVGKMYIVNSVEDKETGMHFYPDMLFSSPFEEAPIITSDKIVSSNDMRCGFIHDMESSAFVFSASSFLAPSKISLLKCVSDNGIDNVSNLSLDLIYNLISSNKDRIIEFLSVLDDASNLNSCEKLQKEVELLVDEYSEKLYLSEYMRNELKTIIHFCKLSDTDFEEIVEAYLPVNNRKEGKAVLKKLYEQFV